MHLYRISREEYANQLTASGRAGRWNVDRQEVIYTSSSRALASLELLVHRAAIRPVFLYKLMVIEVREPLDSVKEISVKDLPEDWRSVSAYPKLQKLGSKWYEMKETLLLKVPSVVIPSEYNFIINTSHPAFKQHVRLLGLEDYLWDQRLV